MISITGLGAPGAPARARGPNRPSAAFHVSVAAEPAVRPGATDAVGLVGMLALQEDGSEEGRDREARRHGQEMLDELAGLQRDLLGPGVGRSRLDRLAALADDMPEAADAGLRAALAMVSLRARVELARRAMPARQAAK